MRVSSNLLQAIAIGVTVSALSVSCKPNDMHSGMAKKEKKQRAKKIEEQPFGKGNCPNCGMG